MTKTPEELTADWKAGKLAAGYYYIKFKNGEIETRDNLIGGFLMNMKNPIVQVIAPVPTYDEYKAMQAAIGTNKRLRGLLKDIKIFFEECNPHDFTVVADNMDFYLTCINAALGDNEIQANPVDNIKIQESEE